VNILHTVELYHPSVGGMQEVVKQLSERLVKLGHKVTVATTRLPHRKEKTVNGVKIAEFSVSGNLARGLSGDVESYRHFLLRSGFDIINNFAAQQWATDVMITMLDRIRAKKVFVPTGFSGLYDRRYRGYFERMPDWMKQYDMNVFLSETYRDMAFAQKQGVKNRVLIPNGASEDEFLTDTGINIRKVLGIPADHFLILHVGSHTNLKGHAEAIRIFSKALIKNATFLMAANDVSRVCSSLCSGKRALFNRLPGRTQDGKKIIVTPLPRRETIAAYHAADLFLFPSNVECSPLVLFECMASKTPFLTTEVGNAAEIVEWSKSGMVLPTRKDRKGYAWASIKPSVRMLEDLYGNHDLRINMQQSGFRTWQERFTWGKIAEAYERMYKDLAGGSV
jgi:glycosyltransferase involved in cell wall biosynthesis